MLVVVLTRLLGSSLILKYPLFGGLLAILLDYFDIRLLQIFQSGDLSNYQALDKGLDLYYLALEAYVAYKWRENRVRATAIVLFSYRIVGTLLFEITQNESLLVIFPNIFEYFYLACLVLQKLLKKTVNLKLSYLIILIVLLSLIKIPHEYLLHINKTHPWTKNKYIQMMLNPDYIEQAAAQTLNKVTP